MAVKYMMTEGSEKAKQITEYQLLKVSVQLLMRESVFKSKQSLSGQGLLG